MSFQPVQELCTVEDYLALERASEERHEYLDGRLYAMAGKLLSMAPSAPT